MHGDIRLGAITREKAREFRDALARVPARLPEKLRRLPIRELLKASGIEKLPPPHSATVNKTLTMLSAITSHAEREGLMDVVPGFVNPFGKGLKLAVDEREAESREPFTAGDLTAIFSTGIYTRQERPKGGGGEAAYWLPLIALFTGARQGEIAQLRIGDLRQDRETGTWFFDISTEGGRTIKTASSRRKVPLHPELERLGLLRYRQSLLSKGASPQDPLWPDFKFDTKAGRAGPWSKWFNRYLRDKAGVEDGGKVFHSFRHTFKRMARDAGLSEEMHDALTGHTGGGVGRSYGGGFGLRSLAEAVGRLEVPEVVQGL
jgi:integrase